MRGFYPILDLDSCRRLAVDPLGIAEQLLRTRPALLQLRAKSASSRETFDWLQALRPLTRAAGSLLIANDRPDLAHMTGCDGVHLGQDDLPVAEARQFSPGLRVGLSTHTLTQLREALEQQPDYVAFGPVFTTQSKARAEASVGVELLKEAGGLCRARGIPLVAIGGIGLDRIHEVLPAADLVAVIGAFMDQDLAVVAQRAESLNTAIKNGLAVA